MSRWFRFYADAMRNPKVLRLSDKDFRFWVSLLAVAAENDGHIPPDDDLKRVLGMRLDYLKEGIKRLLKAGLIDPLEDGYEPHNWSKFQYKSDTSTGRVRRHREKRNVSETAPDTETDTETENTPLPPKGGQALVGEPAKPDPVLELVETWNEIAGIHGLPAVRALTDTRRRKAARRIAEHGLDEMRECVGRIACSPFLSGKTTDFRADFDFLVNPSKLTRLQEGFYDKREHDPSPRRERSSGFGMQLAKGLRA